VGKGLGIGAEQPEADFPLQSTDYYPFGLEIPVYGDCDNQIKYNSKELQTKAKNLLPLSGGGWEGAEIFRYWGFLNSWEFLDFSWKDVGYGL